MKQEHLARLPPEEATFHPRVNTSSVVLRRLPEAGLIELRVEDDGPGFTLDAATGMGASGLKLVLGLARQLNGELTVNRGVMGGTEAVLRFPAPPQKEESG